MASDAEEVEGLGRVLTRLALTEDDKLEQVLSRLLPIVIGKLGLGASLAVQKKVLEILSHVNKRTRAAPAVRLPLPELAALYAAPGTGPMARNFAVVYTEQAVARAQPAERFEQLPALLTGLSTRAPQHQEMLLRMAAQCWEHLSAPGNVASTFGSEAQFAARFPFLPDPPASAPTAGAAAANGAAPGTGASGGSGQAEAGEPGEPAGGAAAGGTGQAGANDGAGAGPVSATAAADRALLLRFALMLMLYQPPSAKGPSNPLAAAQAAAAGGGSAGRGPTPMEVDAAPGPGGPETTSGAAPAAAAVASLQAGVPAGMSRLDVAAVEGKAPPSGEALLRRKLGFLNFSAAVGWDPTEVLQVYLAAACDPNDQVSRRGDELLKKRCGIDSQRPPVDLEDPGVVERLFELFHGSMEDDSLPEQERRAPASVALRSRLLSLFCKSVAAANCFPHSLTTVTVCLYGAATTPRLRQGAMEFAVWMFRHAAPEQLAPAAKTILGSLLTLLDDPSTSGGDVTSLTLRGFTYQAVGQLAQKQPEAFTGRTDIAARFFGALATEPAGVRAAVQEATASLSAAFRDMEGEGAAALQQLLLDSVQQQQPEAVRTAALQWAIKLFPFGHIPARHLCILAAGDPRYQIAEAAVEGLQPSKFASGAASASAPGAGSPAYPPFASVLQYLQQHVPALGRRPVDGATLALPAKAFLAAIQFLEACRRQEQLAAGASSAGGMDAAAGGSYLLLLENALLPAAPSELHACALGATLRVAAAQRGAFAAAFADDGSRQQLLLALLGHVDAAARQAAAQLLGLLVPHLGGSSASAGSIASEAAQGPGGQPPPPQQPRVAALCDTLLSTLRAGAAQGARHAKAEQLDGAAAAAGYVAAHLIQGTPPAPQELLLGLLGQLQQLLEAPAATAPAAASATAGSGALRAAAALALGHAALPLALPAGERGQLVLPGLPGVDVITRETALLLQDKDPRVVKRAATALGYLCWAHAGQAAPATAAGTAASAAPAEGTSPTEGEHTHPVGGASGAGSGSSTGGVGPLEASVSALLELRTSKNEEVLFAAGEALCFCFGGVKVTPDDILHTPFASLAAWKQQQEQAAAARAQAWTRADATAPAGAALEPPAPAAMEVERPDAGAAAGPAGAEVAQQGAALASSQSRILGVLLEECMVSSRPEVRCAGAVWLVSLLLHCGRHPRLVPLLPDAQEALSQLLGDQSELTQEMASRGLAAVYDMADEATRKALLDSLVATLSGAPQKRRAVKLSGESQLFEAGQLGSAPGGGGLTTYKELCSLATELGQPDLVFRFMEIANSQAAMNSSRGAAFGFASIAKLAGEQLGPHVTRMLPRLYRYLYDPNGKVRDAMSHIWHALLDDPKAAVTQNFDAIMKALLADIGGSQWRVRESAALALADLLQGRRWEQLQPHFGALWEMTLRVIDDIKESVRLAGIALARSVRGLTLRLADKELTPPSQGRQAVGVALPLLLEKGLPSAVAEVRLLSLDTVCKLAAAAGPELLRPHMALLVPALLEGLSGMEDARLNYVEMHAERLGLDAGRLEGARVAAAQGGPAGETLDLCARCMDAATMAELAPKLGGLVRRGVGLNTRAGAGRFITQVTRRLGSSMQPLASQLIRALVEACRADRSAAVRRSYAAAAALLCRYAPASRVDRFVSDALASLTAEGADRESRYVAGLLLRELGREAADVLAARASEVAPPAFMAQLDEDADVAAVWREVWEEATSSSGAGLRMHMPEVVQLIIAGLQSGQWGQKKAAAAAVSRMCQAAGDAVARQAGALLDALLKEAPGRIWDGKEAVLGALGALATACPAALQPEQRRSLVAALLEAAGKKKAAYRKEALVQLEAALLALGGSKGDAGADGGGGDAAGCDFWGAASPLLLELAGSFVEAARGGAAMDTDQPQGSSGGGGAGGEGEPHPGKAVPAAQVAACLGAAFSTAAPATARQHADSAAGALAGLLGAAGRAADQLAAAAAGCRLAEHAARVAAGPGAPAAQQQQQQQQQQRQQAESQDADAVLLPGQPGVAALLQAALRLAEEGKAAQLREECLRLSGLLLEQLWPALPAAERQAALGRLAEVEAREKLPASKAQAAQLAARLRAQG